MANQSKERRQIRILLPVLAVCVGTLVVAAWWYYTSQRIALESSISAELSAIADVKAEQIANWRSERIGDGGVLSSALVAAVVRNILSRGPVAALDREQLQDVLQRFISAFHYGGARLIDRDGKSQLNVKAGQDALESYTGRAATAARGVTLSDLYLNGANGRPWMSLTVPVAGSGAILLDIDPNVFLYSYVRLWPTASRTGETVLVRRQGARLTYLSDGRISGNVSLWNRPPWSMGRPAADLPNTAYRWTDYRGIPVLGVIRPIPESDWLLVAKLDIEEAHAPLLRLAWGMALGIALIAAVSATGASLVWRSQQVQIYRDREAWFRQITNDTPAYLWMTTPGVASCFINQRYAHFLGTDLDRIDALWQYHINPEDQARAEAQYANCVQVQSEYRDEFRIRRFDGEYRWMVAHGLPRYARGGKFAGYAGAFIDVTERREAEEDLRNANRVLALELQERTRSEQEVQALSARLINAHEEERTRLARELHDDISQQVAAVSIAMSNFKKRILAESTDAGEHCGRIQQKLVNLAGAVRRISHELHPSVLQHAGLTAALRNYCSELSELTSHRVVFRVDGKVDPVPAAVALCAYRVTQEALHNSIKHSQVDDSEVFLSCNDGVLCLVVSDRGVGMRSNAAGLGLVSIRERTRLVNGAIEVTGKPGKGVTLTLRIPIPSTEQSMRTEASAGG